METCPELAFLAIDPKIQIIAPWRVPEFYKRFQGRNDLLDYAESTGIPVTSTKAKPYSMDDNIAHCRCFTAYCFLIRLFSGLRDISWQFLLYCLCLSTYL